jgi:4-alpha-glucanotransferase
MNLPGTPSGNWHWRYRTEELTVGIGVRLRQLVQTYDR